MTPRDKHLQMMEQVRQRIAGAKGLMRKQLGQHYKRLKKDLNRYDRFKHAN